MCGRSGTQAIVCAGENRSGAELSTTCAASAIGAIVRFAGATAEPVAYLFALLVIGLLAAGLHGHGQTARMYGAKSLLNCGIRGSDDRARSH